MEYFVKPNSIVRKIWGSSDTILLIFAGAAAEFSLNKAVDWLYFTGKLPSDPLGRLVSTVSYAKQIIFSEEAEANIAIDRINSIHKNVENNRGMQIPDWAYRDVLYMLIHYSIAAYELLERKLSEQDKEEIFQVFYRVGTRMNLRGLPKNYDNWLIDREILLEQDLFKSEFTFDLYKQYRKHLGPIRYILLKEVQKLIMPKYAQNQLCFSDFSIMKPIIFTYKFSRKLRIDKIIKSALLPPKYYHQIIKLDSNH